ncbi:MAG: hypothetical protein GX036_11000 [Firmicutes bacterium]|jgi:protein arginine kinase activator|nr:hypothetical protein [Bacillota bacterium]
MWCEQCKERPATVHITKVINNHKTEKHLCEVCAQTSGSDLGFLFEPSFSFQKLLTGLLEGEMGMEEALAPSTMTRGRGCPVCGLTFSDFRRIGRLGCGDCYTEFGTGLDPLLRRIHGSTVHNGKAPKRTGGAIRVKKEIEQLRKKLKEAIQREAYEEAAKLRDEIRAKEKNMKEENNE